MEKVVKFGVVGLRRGRSVLQDALGSEKIKLVAICDSNIERLEAAKKGFTEDYGVKNLQCFDDYDEFLQADIDAVFVATDATCHVPFVIKALEAGKHVLSEIPTIASLEEAKELKKAVKAHPELVYMCGENLCFIAYINLWKKFYEEGKLGDVVYAESEYVHGSEPVVENPYKNNENHWRKYIPSIKYLTHNLGPLLYLMNDRVKTVTCFEPEKSNNPYRKSAGNGVALFKTEKGAVIKIFIGFDSYVKEDHNFLIYGTKGSVETDRIAKFNEKQFYASFSEIPGTRQEKIKIPVSVAYVGEEGGGHGGVDRKMMIAFVDSIINKSISPLDVDFGIHISLAGILAHESAINGGMPIEIPVIE